MSKITEYCASNHQPADFTKTELEHWFDDSYTNDFMVVIELEFL